MINNGQQDLLPPIQTTTLLQPYIVLVSLFSVSTNVNHSINFYTDQTYQPPSYINHYSHSSPIEQYPESGDRSHGFSLNKPDNTHRERFNTINASYEQPVSNNSTARYSGSTYLVIQGNQHERTHERAQSNLSSYGSNSLSLNQNDIYNKQNSKFNIITMQPK